MSWDYRNPEKMPDKLVCWETSRKFALKRECLPERERERVFQVEIPACIKAWKWEKYSSIQLTTSLRLAL
jgi:hypothetical protein